MSVRSNYQKISSFVLFFCVCTVSANAQTKDIPAHGPATVLFDGKDLCGWKANRDEKWVVEQGAILGESVANKYGYLATKKTYRDFDLLLKFKGEANGNAGLLFAFENYRPES